MDDNWQNQMPLHPITTGSPHKRFLKGRAGYLAGIALTFIGTFGYFFIGGGTDLGGRLTWGLLGGGFAWLLLLGPEILTQLALRKLARSHAPHSPRTEFLIMNSVTAVTVVVVLAIRLHGATPTRNFERMISAHVPPSVRRIEQIGSRRMDGEFWLLRFEIREQDLEDVLKSGGFKQANKSEYGGWDKMVWQNTGWFIEAAGDWQIFEESGLKHTRTIFFNGAKETAIFVLDVH